MTATSRPGNPAVSTLSDLLGSDFSTQLTRLLNSFGGTHAGCFLRVEARICPTAEYYGHAHADPNEESAVGYLDLQSGRPVHGRNITPVSSPAENGNGIPSIETGKEDPCDTNGAFKRRKVVGALRPCSSAARLVRAGGAGSDSELDGMGTDDVERMQVKARSIRQVHASTRFPQRSIRKEPVVPVMTPTSTDKLITGIWRQIHSEVRWSRADACADPSMNIYGGMSREAFRVVNSLCFTYHNQSQSSRALEMIVQAYWVDCYEARIIAIGLEQPGLSATEARMTALREACAVQRLTEKDLRNRLAIWRGYKEIKDAGGWVSLVFAGTGVYRFCKYRIGFNEGLVQRLRQLRHGFEVAADTLHPEWRELLGVVGQKLPPQYQGHPHEWVVFGAHPAQPLRSTYSHLGKELEYQFLDDCVIDETVFGARDPRKMPQSDPEICVQCQQRQSDEVRLNRCSCFPNLFGCVRLPPPVQIFRTGNGKNNGVVARLGFERGTAVGEFVGLVTAGINGVDVMMGGTLDQSYQIFQGKMGNFTRFINHSCHPNAQFQRFCWRGTERIVVVSRGIQAGSEITVDYSDNYWKDLDKACLCGEPSCRFPERARPNERLINT